MKILKSNRNSFLIILAALILLSHAYVIFSPANSLMNWYSSDDAFYYFKTAQNIAEGRGISFDGINRTSGFHPLWMLVCVPVFALARFDLILPLRLLVLVLAILNAATSVLLYRLIRRYLSEWTARLAAIFWAFYPLIHVVTTQQGLEAGLNAFTLVLFIDRLAAFEENYKTTSPRIWDVVKLSLFAMLPIFSRLDNIFVIGAAGIWFALRSFPRRHMLVWDALLVIISVVVSYAIRLGVGGTFFYYKESGYWMAGAALVLKLVAFLAAGLYRQSMDASLIKRLLRTGVALTAASVGTGVFMLGAGFLNLYNGFPRTALLVDWGFSMLLFCGLRTLEWLAEKNRPQAAEKGSLLQINWKEFVRSGLAFFIPLGLALGVYMLASYLYFGTPTPVSGQLKHWWGTLANTVYGHPADSLWKFMGMEGAWYLVTSFVSIPGNALYNALKLGNEEFYWAFVAVAWVFLGWLIWLLLRRNLKLAAGVARRFNLLPFFAGGFLQVFYYQWTGYLSTREWYWVSQMITILLALSILLECLYQNMKRAKVSEVKMARGAIAAGTAVWLLFAFTIVNLVPYVVKPEDTEAYLGGVVVLEKATEPGAHIGSPGGGGIAYFIKDRTIINLDGLMNSYDYFQALKSGKANDFYRSIHLDYVYGSHYVVEISDPYGEIFKGHLQSQGKLAGSFLFKYYADGFQ